MKETKKSLFPFYKEIDIGSREHFRVYVFPNGEEIKINNPEYLIVSDNGHRIRTGEFSHYIPYGWIHLYWKSKEGKSFYCKDK